MKNNWWVFIPLLLLGLAGMPGCEKCKDCGPSDNYPYVNVRFYNIDSLVKLQNKIIVLNDSINILDSLISSGNDSLNSTKSVVQGELNLYQEAVSKINNSEIKIDNLRGSGTGKILYFLDSTTNDTLSYFRFPLDANNTRSEFIVTINGRIDTLGLEYRLNREMHGSLILIRAWDLSLYESSYDSVNLKCKQDSCESNNATLSVYF